MNGNGSVPPISPTVASIQSVPPTPSKLNAAASSSLSTVNRAQPTAGPSSDLWSSILDSVSGSKGVVTKNVIILGSPKSGKSTLLSRLASPSGEASNSEVDESGGASGASGSGVKDLDLGLSYSSFDVGDEADEETVARLGVYQLNSPAPPYPALLPLALSKATLLDSLVVVVLDWERPWRFLKDLRSWLAVLDGVLKGKGVAEGWEGAEARERLEAHLRHYSEPAAAGSTSTSTGASVSQLAEADTPLPAGVLTHNPGLQIVVVCTKADQINTLEREKDFKEEQFDYVQQSLRTICLKYGASLFFTSHTRPTSFAKLRSYILHRLFSQPSSLTTTASTSISSATPGAPPPNSAVPTTAPPGSRAFPFRFRANVVDRDQVLVPTGWDSWGKIRILRDRYDADAVGKGWELDMDREMARISRGANGGESEAEERVDEDGKRVVSALKMYEEVVLDLDGDDQPINMANSRVEALDEQDFLKTHYETLQKDREKDPRAAFAARPNAGGAPNEMSYGASVVGPMGSSGLSLPSVERALDRDPDDVAARLAKLTRRESTTSAGVRSPTLPNFGSPALNGTSPTLNGGSVGSPNLTSSLLSPSTSSTGTPGSTSGGGQAQNEVLANFFQSLLAARGTNGAAPPRGVTSLATSGSPRLGGASSTPGSAAGSTAMGGSRSNSQQN